jgi:outer membrane lipoprotein-sorting protein
MVYALACLGILITTGGCAESATAPSAASIEASANRSRKPAPADSVVTTTTTSEDISISGGVILNGGGRSD